MKEIQPMEMSKGNPKQLKDILAKKAKESLDMKAINNLHILSKSKFYRNGDKLREHIATYKNQAILIKQEQILEDIDDKNQAMFPVLIKLEELKKMKKVNGNIIRKIQPKSLHEFQKMALVQGVINKMDSMDAI